MTLRLVERPFSGMLADAMPERPGRGLAFWWLGQAGFVIDLAGLRLVVDPYLTDSLARKYAGTARPHQRMMPPPIEPTAFRNVDAVLVTHAHTDHADPDTLAPLILANPAAQLIAPAAAAAIVARRANVGPERMVEAEAGRSIPLPSGGAVIPTRAAHETLETDADGRHHFLGYVLCAGGLRLWHSGDCVLFDGLVEEVGALFPDIALLPVNGRNADRLAGGVPGNFTLVEAIGAARRVGASAVVAHHYGMFDFNTLDPETIDAASSEQDEITLLRAKVGVSYVVGDVGPHAIDANGT